MKTRHGSSTIPVSLRVEDGQTCEPKPFSTIDQKLSKLSRRQLLLLGLTVAGVTGILILVKRRKIVLTKLKDLIQQVNTANGMSPAFSFFQFMAGRGSYKGSEQKKPKNLADCKFGYQDVFDVEGARTGFGSSDWELTHEPARESAGVIKLLLEQGAMATSKQIMDEFGLSMFGRNMQDGTPDNPTAPKHFCGGAASGSGVAVAANQVDFSLAMDTIGGVRIPGAFCGILGFRASHGSISMAGVTHVAPTLDTVGVLSRDPGILLEVVRFLLQQPNLEWSPPKQVIIADDCFGLSTISSMRTSDVMARAVSETLGRSLIHHVNLGAHIISNVPTLQSFLIEEERILKQDTSKYSAFDGLRDAMLLILRGEFKEHHQKWFVEINPKLAPEVDARVKFALAAHLDGLHRIALKVKEETRVVLNDLLLNDVLLILPSTPALPPSKTAKNRELEIFESRALSLLSIATMASCCQVTLPMGKLRGIPISVSVLARYGGDMFLLESLNKLYLPIKHEVDLLAQRKSSLRESSHLIARNSIFQSSPEPLGRRKTIQKL